MTTYVQIPKPTQDMNVEMIVFQMPKGVLRLVQAKGHILQSDI